MGDNSGGGIGFLGALFLLFLGLKLGGIIDWAWVYIFMPLWIPALVVIVILLFVLIFVWLASELNRGIKSEYNWMFKKKKKKIKRTIYDEDANLFATYDERKWWQIWKR